MKKRYGFISAEAVAKGSGTALYRTPYGGFVEVHTITDDPTGAGYKWPDAIFLGEVTEYIGAGRVGKDQEIVGGLSRFDTLSLLDTLSRLIEAHAEYNGSNAEEILLRLNANRDFSWDDAYCQRLADAVQKRIEKRRRA